MTDLAVAGVDMVPGDSRDAAEIGRSRVRISGRRKLGRLYDLREPEPSQSFALIASSAAGYTSVPLVSTCAPGVSFAGSTLPLPMMCMTGTPCANR